MSTYQNLIFDLDDTLLLCGKYYMDVRNEFKLYQEKRTGVPADIVDKMLNDFDLSCTKLPNAFNRERYPRSFAAISAALDIVNGNAPCPESAHHSFDIGNSVFTADYIMFKGVRDLLVKYKMAGFRLFLCTKGDTAVQQYKIDKHNLQDIFPVGQIYIVPKKTGEVVTAIMLDHQLDPTKTIFIGDSLKDDVGSAHAAGIHAVHIGHPEKPVWAYDDGKNVPEFCLESVTELPTAIPL